MKRSLLFAAVLLVSCTSKKEDAASTPDPSSTPHAAGKVTEVTYKAPDAWIAEPPAGMMRKAQFKIPGKTGEDAEMAVFHFPGTGGSVEANIDRWYGQFKQPDGTTTKEKAKEESREVNGLKVTIVSATGIYLKPVNPNSMGGPVTEVAGYGLKAAIVETESGPWFFKMVGPEQTLNSAQKDFDSFVGTFAVR